MPFYLIYYTTKKRGRQRVNVNFSIFMKNIEKGTQSPLKNESNKTFHSHGKKFVDFETRKS